LQSLERQPLVETVHSRFISDRLLSQHWGLQDIGLNGARSRDQKVATQDWHLKIGGQASRQPVNIDAQRLVVPNHSITGFYLGAYVVRRDLIRSTLEELIGYVLDERLELQVGAVLPLARASEAHRLLEGRKTTGKVVLQPWVEVA
jgi:hypothetical protein